MCYAMWMIYCFSIEIFVDMFFVVVVTCIVFAVPRFLVMPVLQCNAALRAIVAEVMQCNSMITFTRYF